MPHIIKQKKKRMNCCRDNENYVWQGCEKGQIYIMHIIVELTAITATTCLVVVLLLWQLGVNNSTID